MRNSVLIGAMMSFALGGAAHAEWSRGWVIDFYEPAFYYGADDGGDAAPGTDCPLGAMPEPDWQKKLSTAWRTEEEVATILDPEAPTRTRDGPFVGPAPDINVIDQPWTIPDPGVFEVVGDVAYGFDLDDDPSTGGFTSVDGQTPGIDNEYYRALGCLMTWRGAPRKGHHQLTVMEAMLNGRFTVVLVLSGEGDDPENDENARLGFYMATDNVVMDGVGEVAAGYTYRIDPQGLQWISPARVRDGVIESVEPGPLTTRAVDAMPAVFKDARFRFEVNEAGELDGFLGGYRKVNDLYEELAMGGVIYEFTMRMNTPAVWYALNRMADHAPEEGGPRSMISTAYRYFGKPAYIVTPDATQMLTDLEIFEAPEGAELVLRR